ncbi:hypothetical protein PHMEG_00039949 [Phytophthora megakarya]|uniref:Uncharacterized protein n=1 Tax=Phytophthora megakarya TaxID=4795 RepID=A0A225UET5_9STRA|nr:hypothetical protein PHMEG_00039949 [Phytophthora megakarya]
MVRVPGPSGNSGFHGESQEDVKIKEEYGEDKADLDQDPDLEEKPRIPLKAATVATAELDETLDLYTTDKEITKLKSSMLTKSATSTKSSKKKNIKAARTKLKAPDLESEDVNKPGSTIAKDMIEQAYYRKVLSETLLHDTVLAIIQVGQILLDLLQEAGLVAGEFDPGALFEMELGVVQSATQDLYKSLKILVVERVQPQDLNYQTGSSHYASATSEPDSDSPRAPQHMSLGPSGTKYLRSRVNRSDQRPAGPSQRTPRISRKSATSQEVEPFRRPIRPDLATT